MRDKTQTPNAERRYECFECGTVVVTAESPGSCPECGGDLRNRGTPIE
ncbi:rubrerythrin-like domain-containing protein [Natronomonas gomsonensis]|nr:rubrerythrin-like domain-containing protein [Natronomonas gomsonensis]MCY4731770.1 rubrerythrin-like domain-containing protein [Natronomonas gomsonensis]